MEYVKTQYHVTLCWWLYSSAVTKKGFDNIPKQLRLWHTISFLLHTMNWSHALGMFLGTTTNMCCGIHMR
jgi:hypothetical protein